MPQNNFYLSWSNGYTKHYMQTTSYACQFSVITKSLSVDVLLCFIKIGHDGLSSVFDVLFLVSQLIRNISSKIFPGRRKRDDLKV